jgi:tetratricopeptide (TPR) repeat protein
MSADAASAYDVESKAKIFISYSRQDMAFADRLEAALTARGFEPLIDRTEIYAFEDWWQRIQVLIGRADTIVFVLSPDAVASDVALKEVAHGAVLNKRFAPIVARRVEDAAVPEPLRRLNFIFFDDPSRFETSADQLAEALATDIGWVRQHTEFGEAARRWVAAGRSGGLLLRSPVLEEAERWIASRPRGAPEPTPQTQTFIVDGRRGTTRRRNILTGSLAAGLVAALVLAGLAFWQREVAVQQRQIAEQQRKRAENTLAAATDTANSLVFDLARRFRDSTGIPSTLIKDILDRARALQEQLTKSGQVNPELKRSEAVALDETAKSLLAIGDTNGALAAAEQCRKITAELLASRPDNTDSQRNQAVAEERVGDVLVAQGELVDALTSYHRAIAIREQLAKAHPANTMWENDLSVAFDKIGNVLKAQGNLPEALKAYGEGAAIAGRLARVDPGNAGWQRELATAGERIGDVLMAQGNLPEALKSYRDGLAICERLVRADPGNTMWQHDISASRQNVGDVLLATGDLADALKSYREALATRARLAGTDPTNALWQRDLAVAYSKIGNVLKAQGNLPEALKSFRSLRAIADRQARANPGNAEWQRGLSESYDRVGDVLAAQGDLTNALKSYRDSLTIRLRLVSIDSSNAQWRADLKLVIGRIGGLAYSFLLARDFTDALAAADQALSLAPEERWLYTNRAHALMFLGRSDEARALYLKYRDVKDVQDGKPWTTVILQDFADLRKKGLTNPLMNEIEKQFTSAG